MFPWKKEAEKVSVQDMISDISQKLSKKSTEWIPTPSTEEETKQNQILLERVTGYVTDLVTELQSVDYTITTR